MWIGWVAARLGCSHSRIALRRRGSGPAPCSIASQDRLESFEAARGPGTRSPSPCLWWSKSAGCADVLWRPRDLAYMCCGAEPSGLAWPCFWWGLPHPRCAMESSRHQASSKAKHEITSERHIGASPWSHSMRLASAARATRRNLCQELAGDCRRRTETTRTRWLGTRGGTSPSVDRGVAEPRGSTNPCALGGWKAGLRALPCATAAGPRCGHRWKAVARPGAAHLGCVVLCCRMVSCVLYYV